MTNLVAHSENFAMAWHDDRKLSAYLKSINIVEDVRYILDYDYTCEFTPEGDIP